MSRRLLVLTVLVAASPLLAASDTPRDPRELALPPLTLHAPTPVDTTLSNGIRVLVFENHDVPIVTLSAHVSMGSRYLAPADRAAYRLLSRVWDEGGAGALSPAAVDSATAANGVTLSAYAGESVGAVTAYLTSADLDAGLALWYDLLRAPRWDAERLERAKAQLIKDYRAINDDPDRLATTWFARLLYGPDTPGGHTPGRSEIDAVTRDDLVALHARFVVPVHTVIGIAGDVTLADALARLEQLCGDWHGDRAPAPLTLWPWQPVTAPGVYWLPGDFEQCHVRMGRLLDDLKRTSPEFPIAQVHSYGVGFLRVYFATRQAGLSYGTAVRLDIGRERTELVMFGSTAAENVPALFRTVEDALASVRVRPLGVDEVSGCRTFFAGGLINHMETAGAVVEMILRDIASGLPPHYSQDLVERYLAVDAADVAAHVREWTDFGPAPVVLVVGRPAGGMADLEALGRGPVTVLTPITFGE